MSGRHLSSWNSLSALKRSLPKEPVVTNLLAGSNSNLLRDKKSVPHPNRHYHKSIKSLIYSPKSPFIFAKIICFSLSALSPPSYEAICSSRSAPTFLFIPYEIIYKFQILTTSLGHFSLWTVMYIIKSVFFSFCLLSICNFLNKNLTR